jgi:fucose permease
MPRRLTALLIGFLLLEVGAEGALGGWLFTYARARGASNGAAFYLNSAFWAVFTGGRLLSIPLALRLSERRIIPAHLLLWLAVSVAALVIPNVSLALWICAIGSGLAMAPIFPMTLALAQHALHLTGKVTGWFLVSASLGAMTLPWLIGQFFEARGAQTLMRIVVIDLLASGALLAAVLWQTAPGKTAG